MFQEANSKAAKGSKNLNKNLNKDGGEMRSAASSRVVRDMRINVSIVECLDLKRHDTSAKIRKMVVSAYSAGHITKITRVNDLEAVIRWHAELPLTTSAMVVRLIPRMPASYKNPKRWARKEMGKIIHEFASDFYDFMIVRDPVVARYLPGYISDLRMGREKIPNLIFSLQDFPIIYLKD